MIGIFIFGGIDLRLSLDTFSVGKLERDSAYNSKLVSPCNISNKHLEYCLNF